MANKRVPQLQPIFQDVLNPADLMLVSDVSAHESKKVSLNDLGAYLVNNSTGTASYARRAISASYSDTSYSASNALTAAYALYAPTPSVVAYAVNAGHAYTSTNATTGTSASYSKTSSIATTASYTILGISTQPHSNTSDTASYLLYSGVPNGLISSAISASWASSSFSSSWASSSISSSLAETSSYAINGIQDGEFYNISVAQSLLARTASYIENLGLPATLMKDYGIAFVDKLSTRSASISNVQLSSLTLSESTTSIECFGTAIVKFSGSYLKNETLELIALNRWSGITQSLDKTPIKMLQMNSTGNTGSFALPFILAGQAMMDGPYKLYVTTSISTSIDLTRTPRINIVSNADSVVYASDELMVLTTDNPDDLLTTTCVGPITQEGSASQYVTNGSSSLITEIDLTPVNGAIEYVWTLSSLDSIIATDANYLTSIGGVPPSITNISINGAFVLDAFPPLTSVTALRYLDLRNLPITKLPSLPATMSMPGQISVYDCPIQYVPPVIPYNTYDFENHNTNIVSVVDVFFPPTLGYLSLTDLPYFITFDSVIPVATEHLYFSNCPYLAISSEYNIANNLVNNAANNGVLDFTTGVDLTTDLVTSASLAGKLDILRSRGWTVTI